jgi:hypothetical protein
VRRTRAHRGTSRSGQLGLSLVSSQLHASEDILEKYEGLTLAGIYSAIAYALANREEIGSELPEEERLEREALAGAAHAMR